MMSPMATGVVFAAARRLYTTRMSRMIVVARASMRRHDSGGIGAALPTGSGR